MENRRPPHAKTPGRYTDRSRVTTSSYRRGGGGNSAGNRGNTGGSGGAPRGRGSPDGTWDQNRFGRPGAGRDERRRVGRPNRNEPRRFGDNDRFGQRSGRPGGRAQADRKAQYEEPVKLTSDAQITDGKFRGRTLQNSNSPLTVPTKRKIRETTFRILSRRVKACRLLDLGAASGTFGIEALSRGAMLATFVERSARMCSYIQKNLTELGIKDGHGEVIEMEILPYLKRNARRRRTWDIIYIDLPDGDEHAAIVDYLSRGQMLKQAGLLIIQHAPSKSYPEKLSQLNRWRTVDQGETILTMYERI